MLKREFLDKLRSKLSGLPKTEIEERLSFYGEMIDDRIEEGLTEENAVAAIGPVDEIAAQIVADTPLVQLAKERIKPRQQLKAWEIVLLVLGSPIWLSLAISAIAVAVSLYAAWWSVVGSLWAVFGSVVGVSVGGVISGMGTVFADGSLAGIALIGASLICAGISIFLYFGCKAATKGTVVLTKKIVLGIKKRLVRKEGAK